MTRKESSSTNSTTGGKKPSKETSKDGWTIEYLASIFSVLSFAGLVALLAAFDRKASFNFHGVTINALVAILSTASQASLMVPVGEAISQANWIMFARSSRKLYDLQVIDSASRSALGRCKLLLRMPLSVASIGALTALLALAFNAFTQQLVHTYIGHGYSDDSGAQLPIAQRYAAGNVIFPDIYTPPPNCNGNNGQNTGLVPIADFGIQSSVLFGLTQSGSLNETIQQLKPSCPSGNCTWSPVDSLAVCSKCTKLNDKLTAIPSSSNQPQWALYATNIQAGEVEAGSGFALPNGLWLENANTWFYDQYANPENAGESYAPGAILMATYGTSDPSTTLTFQSSNTLIWSLTLIRALPDPKSNSTTWPHLPLEALECGLEYCVNTFNASTTNGILSESSIPSNSSRNPRSWQPLPFSGPIPLSGSEGTSLTPSQISSLAFDQCVSTVSRSDLSLGSGFNLSQTAVDSISGYMSSTFSQPQTKNETRPERTLKMNGYYIQTEHTTQWGPASMQPLLLSPDLGFTFEAVARSMTNSLRLSSVGADHHSGRNGVVQIKIRVEWGWISLPALVVLGGLAQLGLAVVASRRSRAPVWKSSLLALLAQAGRVGEEKLGGAKTVGEMEGRAEGERVELFDPTPRGKETGEREEEGRGLMPGGGD